MTDRQLKAIDLFCEYLNQFTFIEGPELDFTHFTYTPDNWEPTKNEHASVETLASYSTGWYDCEVYELSDGDDGGPNILTVYFHQNAQFTVQVDDTEPIYATQEFDTSVYLWLEEGKVTRKP